MWLLWLLMNFLVGRLGLRLRFLERIRCWWLWRGWMLSSNVVFLVIL